MILTGQEPADARTPAPPVAFQCIVPAKLGHPPDQVCERFRLAIAQKLGAPVAAAGQGPLGKGKWVVVKLVRVGPASIEAALTSRLGNRVRNYAPITLDVMDKALDMREIDILARQVAAQLR